MKDLIEELKIKIIETLNLSDVSTEEIQEAGELVGDLGLDSIDVLELAMMIQKDYSVKIDNNTEGQKIFLTLNNLASYIYENRPEKIK